jgi:hypothetical protein
MLRIDTQFIQNLEQLSSGNSTLLQTLEKYKSYKAKIQEFKNQSKIFDAYGLFDFSLNELEKTFSLNECHFLLASRSSNTDFAESRFLVDYALSEIC